MNATAPCPRCRDLCTVVDVEDLDVEFWCAACRLSFKSPVLSVDGGPMEPLE